MFTNPCLSLPFSGSSGKARRRSRSLAKLAFGVAFAGVVMTAGQARAVIVTVGGQDWDVTTFTGAYNDNTAKFQTAANGGVMPWWGSESLAGEFATTVSNSLGFPNLDGASSSFFGWDVADNSYVGLKRLANYPPNAPYLESSIWVFPSSAVWAQATPASPSSVPGPLPALGAAAAFGFSRKLRKRIKNNTSSVSSSYSL